MGKRLFVGNLPYEAAEADLRKAVEGKGYAVEDVAIINDRETGKSRGFGFVTIGDPDRLAEAIEDLDGTMMAGRTLRVNEAHERERRPRGKQGGDKFRAEPRQDPMPPPPQSFDEDGGGGRQKRKKDKKRRRQRREEKSADW